MERILRTTPFLTAIGASFLAVSGNSAKARLEAGQLLRGERGEASIQPGVILGLLDEVGGRSVMARLGQMASIATLDLRVDYVGRGSSRRPVIGECRCVGITDNFAFVQGSAYHESEYTPIATCTASFVMLKTG